MYYDWGGYRLDWTGPQMVLTMRMTSFSYNYYDGVYAKVNEKFFFLVRESFWVLMNTWDLSNKVVAPLYYSLLLLLLLLRV